MSETENHRGKLKFLPRTPDTSLEEQCELISVQDGYKFDTRYHKNWKECIEDEGYQKYIIVKDSIFMIYDHNKFEEYSFEVIRETDDTFTFVGSFYNGGTCLQEMLEEELSRLI